jgi:hypothetical protein
MSFLVLSLSLLACWEEETIVDVAEPTPAPALREGAYEIQVLGVEHMACEGVRPQDVVGQSLHANLRVAGETVAIDFEGWELAGTMADGALFAEGSATWEHDYPDDVDVEAPGSVGAGESDADVDEGEVGYEEEEAPRDEPPAGEGFYAALDVDVMSERLGGGFLTLEMPGCSFDLEVAMLFGAPGEPPVVVVPDEPAEEPGGEEPPCGRETDCG